MSINNFTNEHPLNYLHNVAQNVGKLTLKVFDSASGFITKSISTHISELDEMFQSHMDELSNGTYIINAFSGDKFVKSIKFIKE